MDPLSLFPGEKTAAEEEHRKERSPKIQRREKFVPSRSSMDAGERAIAGLSVVSHGLAKMVPHVINKELTDTMYKGVSQWRNPPVVGAKELSNYPVHMVDQRKTKVLGLLEAASKPAGGLFPTPDLKKMNEVAPLVDSFMKRHKLTGKGVTFSAFAGPLSGGPVFDFLDKRVHLPITDKHVVMHELGHVLDESTPIGKIRYRAGAGLRAAMATALPVAFLAGDEIKKAIPGTVDDKAIDFLQQNAPAITAATMGAVALYPEIKATMNAVEHIKHVEGAAAAKDAAIKLLPATIRPLTAIIPATIGMALARKYMNEMKGQDKEISERKKKILSELEKTGSLRNVAADVLKSIVRRDKPRLEEYIHVGKSIAESTRNLVHDPHVGRRLVQAAKHVGTSPEFAHGALTMAFPTTLGALFLYGTPSGAIIRGIVPEGQERLLRHANPEKRFPARKTSEEWREKHPLRFAGLVGLGAALSSGVISKLWSDLHKVL